MADHQQLVGQVDGDHADRTAIIAVDGADAIDHGQPVAQRRTGSGPDLDLETRRDLHLQPGRDQPTLQRGQHDFGAAKVGAQIGTGRARRLVSRQGQRGIRVIGLLDQDFWHHQHEKAARRRPPF